MAGAIVGGLVGGIVGTPIFPIVGTIAGSIIGCALGAYLIETSIGKTHTEATTVMVGAAKGRFVGLVAKSTFGIVMGLIATISGIPLRPSAPTSPANLPPPPSTSVPTSMPSTAPTSFTT